MIYFSYYRELFRKNSYSNLSTSIVVHWTHLPSISFHFLTTNLLLTGRMVRFCIRSLNNQSSIKQTLTITQESVQ
ncbi:hypothetical protein SPAP_0151 [Streptococcus pneumoniae AP200]|nr:hypothetical protein SPAP_0151 [Streptococcus pneumoniae AP200]